MIAVASWHPVGLCNTRFVRVSGTGKIKYEKADYNESYS